MQFHQLQSLKRKRAKRIGRGGKRGTYSGRGIKGQHARAGGKLRPEFRDIIKKLPKKRGYRTPAVSAPWAEVMLRALEKKAKDGDMITPKILVKMGLVETKGRKTPKIKILGSGAITKKITIKGCGVSAGARKAIEAAGGSVQE